MCMWLITRLEDYKSIKLLRFRSAQKFSWSDILSVLNLVQAVATAVEKSPQAKKELILLFKTLKFKTTEPKYIQI